MLTIKSRKHSTHSAVDRAIREAFDSVPARHRPTRTAFDRLVRHSRHAGLLRPAPSGGRSGSGGSGEVVGGLLALAGHVRDWLRGPESWEPAGDNPLPRFASLARHLLAAYPVPAFMTSAWLEGQAPEARRRQGWFAHIGAGRNIRTAELPLPYTRMMAHHFLQAPDHFTIEQALRWGQVRGLGGSKGMAVAVAATHLGRSFESEDFRVTVVRFLADHPELDLARVGPVIDFLHDQGSVPGEAPMDEGERVEPVPPRPVLSMKGRTLRSLLRRADEWHERQKRRGMSTTPRWEPSGIGGFLHVERAVPEGLRRWTIRELTSGEELRREGEAMRHCVASYAGACARGDSTIWSMMFENDERRFRVMTIEVDPSTRTICQARRRGNASSNEKALAVMKLWAARVGLTLGFWRAGVLVTE